MNYILDHASSPMLVGQGIKAPEQRRDANGAVVEADAIEIGPKQILFAPMNADGQFGNWHYIAPDAASITETRIGVEGVRDDFRRLAMQPTVQRSGNITATATSVDTAKAHSALQAWAGILQDRLNEALAYVAAWMQVPDTVTVVVSTDFHGDASGVAEAQVLASAQQRQVISKAAEVAELRRRNILGPDFNPEQDELQIASETTGLEPEQPIDAVSGNVIQYRSG
jgi:hypothetical protein